MSDILKKYKEIIAIAIIGLVLAWPSIKDSDVLKNLNFGSSTEVVEIINLEVADEPSDAMKIIVADISDEIVGETSVRDSQILAQFYSQLSKIIRKNDFPQSTGQFREYHSNTLKANLAGAYKGQYPNLGVAIDKAIMEVIGDQSVALDATNRSKLADVLSAISWDIYH